MNANFPNREPVITRSSELHVIRRLPGNAEIKVRAGERLSSNHVLARTDPLATAVKISIADQLGCSPSEVTKQLLKPVGSTYNAGEALARARRGLRNVVVASPIAGTLLSLDAETGIALIAPGGSGDIRALVPGDVEFVDGKQTVSIRTVGHRVYGIVGVGPAVAGPLRMLAQSPGEALDPSRITQDVQGSIVVGGAWASAAGIKKLIELGAVGLITGGFVEREIALASGATPDDRLAPWRLSPGEDAIGQSFRPVLGMIATEGFGTLAIAPEIFSFLQEQDGEPAILITSTRVTGYQSRPSLIIPNEAGLDDDAPVAIVTVSNGVKLRLVDQGSLGRFGQVSGPIRTARRGDGIIVEVLDVTVGDEQPRAVPLRDVEALVSRAG